MQPDRFLPDIFSTLFDRRRPARSDDDPRSIAQLCDALLGEEGDVSGLKLSEIILTRYRAFDDAAKLDFFRYINDALDIDATALADLAQGYARTGTTEAFAGRQLYRATRPEAVSLGVRLLALELRKEQPFHFRGNRPLGFTPGAKAHCVVG